MSKCDIIIPVWNQIKYTKRCLDSIIKSTKFPYRLVIIDNGSDKNMQAYLKNFVEEYPEDKIKLIRNEKNLGFIKAVNQGMKLSQGDYICILNNDTIVTEGWLSEMVKILEHNPRIGIVNPSSNNLGQKLPKGRRLEDHAKAIKADSGKYAELMNALGFCMLVRKILTEEIGFFDEIYGMGNFEDTDFSMRAKEKGYAPARALGSYVYHKANTSFNLFRRYHSEFEKNKKVFEARWGRARRILFIITKAIHQKLYEQKINEALKHNNWVYLLAKKNIRFPKYLHSEFRIYPAGAMFGLRILLKMIFKKKRFDDIYCDSKWLSNVIQYLRPLHKATLLKI